MRHYRKAALLLVTAGLLLLTTGWGKKTPPRFSRDFFYFDTVISLSIYSDGDGEALLDQCVSMCGDIENTFSRTREGSVLYNINHRTSNTLEIPEDVAMLIELALIYYDMSDHKFDITVAPLSDLWDFKSEDASVPDAALIQALLPSVGADGITLDGTTLTFASDDIMIDLGALAKGYAADIIKDFLMDQGVTSGILNFGGNVMTIGSKPDGSAWKIGIQKPFEERSDQNIAEIAEVTDKTVVTSGIYERYFIQDDVIYHHILDPDTGYPVQGDIYGVTIITDSSLIGDALSTTCLLLKYEKARELIDSLAGVEAIFILDTGEVINTF